jgi:hypothetical protein
LARAISIFHPDPAALQARARAHPCRRSSCRRYPWPHPLASRSHRR